ncbi:MAG: hypothetical protein ACYSWQ_04685 [Planctomycetota bacterium]|jgi:hypothetical protein
MFRIITIVKVITIVLLSFSPSSARRSDYSEEIAAVRADFANKDFTFREVSAVKDQPGIGKQPGITRRDPSDIIKVDDEYFVYYTYVDHDKLPPNLRRLRASGYVGTIWYATSRNEGLHWIEQGPALGTGAPGSFDSFAVFTPNIVKFENRYWLYYTGVKATPGKDVFENNSVNDFTAIGVAVADSPRGPFKRLSDEPVLTVTPKSADPTKPSPFDSYRIDDAALLVRDYDKDGDEDVWLYYKGRNIDHGRSGPGKTQMGLAIADTPAGPYRRLNGGRPILPSSHEVMIWPHRSGVAAYASASRTLEFAPDGIDFTSNPLRIRTATEPTAPGCFRTDLTNPEDFGRGITWGVSMKDPGGPFPYLLRYAINLLAPFPGPAKDADGRIPNNTIWHLGHSANLLKIDDRVLVFDYPYGTTAMDESCRHLQPEEISSENVYVFVSHQHGDHHRYTIYRWKEKVPRVKFIIPEYIRRRPDDAHLVAPGRTIELDGMKIRAYPSTDEGVAFSIYVGGKHIYFSGDNGCWNYRTTRTPQQYIEEDLGTLDRTTPMDIAFQVCDPLLESQGRGDGGITAFATAFQPKLLIPLHLRGDYKFPAIVRDRLKKEGFKHHFWPPTRPGDVLNFQDDRD